MLIQSSDTFFLPERLGAIDDILEPGRKDEAEYDRVRIAVIDSGVNINDPAIVGLQKGYTWPRVTFCDLIDGDGQRIKDSTTTGVDLVGHGTFVTATILSIAKWAEVYVARVVDLKKNVQPQSVAQVRHICT